MKRLLFASAIGLSLSLAPAIAAQTSASGKADFSSAMMAVGSTKTEATDLKKLTKVADVQVVKVSGLAKGQDMTTWKNVVTKNQADIAALQAAINGNVALKAKLDAQKVKVTDVVAISVATNGTVIVYTNG